MFAHGVFSPVDAGGAFEGGDAENQKWSKEERKAWKKSCKQDGKNEWKECKKGWKQERKALKERKLALKETIRVMKESAVTQEEKDAVKLYKQQMKAEFREAWKGFMQIQRNPDRPDAKHVADVTIPDNSELPADTPVVKTWRLQNSGAVEWPVGSQLIFISKRGDNLNGPERVVLDRPVLPQQEVDLSVPFLTPSEPGRYIAYYRMATADGAKFGHRLWVSFVIPRAAVPAPDAVMTTPATAPSMSSVLDKMNQ